MKKAASILLSLFILLSSLHFRMDTHFCGGELKSASLFGDAEPCSHATSSAHVPLCHSNSENEDDKNCCEDEEFVVEGLDIDTPVNLFHLDLSTDGEFILTIFSHGIKAYVGNVGKDSKYLNYKPPLLKLDIPVFIQTFLI